jgi:ankyrin repeat protein
MPKTAQVKCSPLIRGQEATPLFHDVCMSSGDSSEPSLCAKANVPLSWLAGQPALAYAAGRGDVTCIEVLLELGADAALANGTGGPQAIHRAAASGMCKALPLCSILSWLCPWLLATYASN